MSIYHLLWSPLSSFLCLQSHLGDLTTTRQFWATAHLGSSSLWGDYLKLDLSYLLCKQINKGIISVYKDQMHCCSWPWRVSKAINQSSCLLETTRRATQTTQSTGSCSNMKLLDCSFSDRQLGRWFSESGCTVHILDPHSHPPTPCIWVQSDRTLYYTHIWCFYVRPADSDHPPCK